MNSALYVRRFSLNLYAIITNVVISAGAWTLKDCPGHYSGKAILYTLQTCFIFFETTEKQRITVFKTTAD